MREEVDGCAAMVFDTGGGAVNVKVGTAVLLAMSVGATGLIGVNDGTGVSSCEEGWNGVGVGEEFGS